MAERRTAARLVLSRESLERLAFEKVEEDAVSEHDQTQPMRLSFLALLAERDPLVQTRLRLRRDSALEIERPADDEDDRPTDEMTVAPRD